MDAHPGFGDRSTPSKVRRGQSPAFTPLREPVCRPRRESPRMSRCGCSGSTASSDPAGSVRQRALDSSAGYEKFAEFVAAQDGDVDALVDHRCRGSVRVVSAPARWFRRGLPTPSASLRGALELGAGRQTKGGHPRSRRRGPELVVRVGDEVSAGDPVARLCRTRSVDRAGAGARCPDDQAGPGHADATARSAVTAVPTHDELLALARAAARTPLARHSEFP